MTDEVIANVPALPTRAELEARQRELEGLLTEASEVNADLLQQLDSAHGRVAFLEDVLDRYTRAQVAIANAFGAVVPPRNLVAVSRHNRLNRD